MRARGCTELGDTDLELALGRVRVVGEDVEDDRRPVDDRDAERLLEVALLARQQLVVAGDQVRVRVLDGALQLLELAAPEVVIGVCWSRRWTSSPTAATPAVRSSSRNSERSGSAGLTPMQSARCCAWAVEGAGEPAPDQR